MRRVPDGPAVDPAVALYRLEKEKRAAADKGMDVDEWRRRYGEQTPATPEQLAIARAILNAESERRHKVAVARGEKLRRPKP